MQLTERDQHQISVAVELVRETLDDNAVAMYHYGSALIGSLGLHSDLDLFVVVERSITVTGRRQLIHGLMDASGRGGSRPIELTAVRTDQLRPMPVTPEMDFLYGEWLREEFAAGHVPQPAPNSDLAAVVATVLAGSHAMFGPDAAELIHPVPHERLMACIRASVPSLLDDLPGDFNVLLTLARMWFTIETGQIVAKDTAAEWAIGRLPDELRPALARSRDVYLGRASPHTPGPNPHPTAEHLSELVLDGG